MTAPINMCYKCVKLAPADRPAITDGTIIREGRLLCATHAAAHDAAVTKGGVAH